MTSNSKDSICAPDRPTTLVPFDATLFRAIEHLAFLRKFQRNLHALTGLPFDFVDANNQSSRALQAQRHFTPLCALVRRTPMGLSACECGDYDLLGKCAKKGCGMTRRCHLGLIDIVVPVVLIGKLAGYFCTGQFLSHPPTKAQFRMLTPRLRQLGVNINQAEKAYFQAPVLNRKRINAILDLIHMVTGLIDINRLPLLTAGVRHQPLYRAVNHIERHFQEPVTLKDTAQAAGLSASRLAHVFRDQLDTSFTAYLNMARINAAKNQLTDTTARISEIAFRTGFENLSHFNHLFRRITGLTPTCYRKQHKNTNIRQSTGRNANQACYNERKNKKEMKGQQHALNSKQKKHIRQG